MSESIRTTRLFDRPRICASATDEIDLPSFGAVLVSIDPRYFRPTEVEQLLGDATKAREKLGWVPRTSFAELVSEMMESELATIHQEQDRRDRFE